MPMKRRWSRSMLLGMRMFLARPSVPKYSAYFALIFDLLRLRVDNLLDLRHGSGCGSICFIYSSALIFPSFFCLSWSCSWICILMISSSSESILMTWFRLVFLALLGIGCCWTNGLKSLTKAKAFPEVFSNCLLPKIFCYSPIIWARLGVTLGCKFSGPTMSRLLWAVLFIVRP